MLAGIGVIAMVGLVAAGGLRPTALKCEYQVNPLGIETASPRLSWHLQSAQRGAVQSAYQVLVASSAERLKKNIGDLWDSGRVASSQSVHVAYTGQPLRSRQRVWWKVRAWDRAGHPSDYSAPASLEMGLLKPEEWNGAQWIGLPAPDEKVDFAKVQWVWFPEGDPRSDAPRGHRYFRRAFETAPGKQIKQAILYGAADNSFRAFLNGQSINQGGGWTAWTRLDVTPNVAAGRNQLAMIAENDSGPAGLAALLRLTYADGSVEEIITGPGWKAARSVAGEWTGLAYDDSALPEAKVIAKMGDLPWGVPNTYGDSMPAPYLRKSFTLSAPPKSARLYATALGIYQLSINGQRVGNDIFRPGWTDYHKRIQYQTYDVTKLLQKRGENVLGVVLGNGWYSGHIGLTGRQNYGPAPRALLLLVLENADGTTQRIVTDGSWKAATGPILSDDMLMGETYDARREQTGWHAPGFNDGEWKPVLVEPRGMVPPGGKGARLYPKPATNVPLVAQLGPSVEKFTELKAKSVTEKPAGSYVFDLGQNMVGWARLRVKGTAGTTVRLRFAEMLNPDGSIYTTNLRGAKATDYYTLKGGGEEVYEPTFTFHGFRYVELTGFPGKPGKEAVTGVVVTSATPVSGSFACSNPMVNRLQSNIVWGQMGNYLEAPTDCPQRDERLGWMGDAQVFIRTACYNRDVASFITKWTQDVVDAQSPSGGFPDVTPRIGVLNDGSPAWGDAGVIVPWTVYLHYGDTRLLDQRYPAMAKWIEHIHSANPNLLWINRSGNNYGDWLNIGADMPREIIGTCYFAYSTHLVAKAARVLGKTADAEKYENLFRQIKAAYNAAYVRPDGRILDRNGKGDTQTCYLMALRFDLLSPEMRQLAIRHLVTDIVEKRGTHLSTGFVGVSYLNPTLTQTGHTDVAYRLLNNDTFPSWGYSIKQGATTIWERWDGWTVEKGFQDPGMNSFNHYSLGSVGEWLYHTVAGIDLDPEQPGFKHILLRPRPGGGLTYAKATYDSIQGRIVSDWTLENGTFRWKVVVPANTTATVYIPAANAASVTEGNAPITQAEGVRFLRMEDGAAVYNVGSGTYLFTATK